MSTGMLVPANDSIAGSPETILFKVSYHLHAAGGRLWPTSCWVDASDPQEAIATAERQQRRRDSERGRAPCGFFALATARAV